MTPAVVFLLVLLIGAAVGILSQNVVRGRWLRTQVTGTRALLLTSALVGVAGSFIGYHAALLARLPALGPMPLLLALVGAIVVVFAWRSV